MRSRSLAFLLLSAAPLLAWACTTTTAGPLDFSFDAALPPFNPDAPGFITPDGSVDGALPPTPGVVSIRFYGDASQYGNARALFASPGAVPYQRPFDKNGIATSDPTLVPLQVLVVSNNEGLNAFAVAGAEPGDLIDLYRDYNGQNITTQMEAAPTVPAPNFYSAFDGCYYYGSPLNLGAGNIYINNECTKNGSADYLVTAFNSGGAPVAFSTRAATIVDGGTGSLQVPTPSWQAATGKVTLELKGPPPATVSDINRSVAFGRGTRSYLYRSMYDSALEFTPQRAFEAPPAGFADSAIVGAVVRAYPPSGGQREAGIIGRDPIGPAPISLDLSKMLPFVGPVSVNPDYSSPRIEWSETGSLDGTVAFVQLQLQIQTDAGTQYANVALLFPRLQAGKLSLDWLKGIDSGAVTQAYVSSAVFIDPGSLGYKALREHPARIYEFINGQYGFEGNYRARYVTANGFKD